MIRSCKAKTVIVMFKAYRYMLPMNVQKNIQNTSITMFIQA